MNQKVRFDAQSPSAWWFLARRANYQVPRMASAAGIGVPQLRRCCRKFWGESLEVWLRDQRLLAARHLLAEGSPVKKTASRLGFKSSTHLARIFRETFGCSPREHARRFAEQR
jgi:AraC-like DNA-binding protein